MVATVQQDVYELEFTLERDDLVAYSQYHLAQSRLFTLIRIFVTMGLGTALGVLPASILLAINHLAREDRGQPDWSVFVYGVVTANAVIFALMYANRRKNRRRIAEQLVDQDQATSKALGKRKMIISREGIRMLGSAEETVREWSSVADMVAIDDHIFACADRVFIIPARVIGGVGEIEMFLETVDQWRRSENAA